MVNTYMLAFSGGFGNALLAMDWRAYDQVEGKGDGKGDIPKIYPPNVLRPDLGKIIAFSALIYFIGQLPSPSHPTAFLHAYPHIVWINFCCICQQQRSVAHCKWQISSSMIAMTFSVASECRAISRELVHCLPAFLTLLQWENQEGIASCLWQSLMSSNLRVSDVHTAQHTCLYI